MAWVQANLNYNQTVSGEISADNTIEETDADLAHLDKFEISADKTTAYSEENISLTITAYDQNGDIFKDYAPGENFKISADSSSSRYVRTLKFTKGKTTLNFTDVKTKTVNLTVKDGEIETSIALTFEEAPQIAPDQFNLLVSRLSLELGDKLGIVIEAINQGEKIKNYTPSASFSFKINNVEIPVIFKAGVAELTFVADQLGKIPVEVLDNTAHETLELTVNPKTENNLNETSTTSSGSVIEENTTETNQNEDTKETQIYTLKISGENIGLVGSPLSLAVKAYDENDKLIKDFAPTKSIPVTTNGQGVLQPEALTAQSFVNGVASVSYLTSGEEEATIQIGDETTTLNFISEINPVAAFEVEHDGSFIPSIPETVIIQAIDSDGNKTPDYTFLGKVKFTLIDGAGTFEPAELTGKDFKNGKAEVSFNSTADGDVKIKAQNGAIVGISRYLKADNDGVFSDVDKNHQFAEAIAYLKAKEIITGYADGSFQPEKSVSRVEALKMIIAGLNIDLKNASIKFPDTENPSWYAPYVATGLAENIVAGYPDGSFKPSNQIIRAEYLKVLLEAAKVNLNDTVNNKPYYDVDKTEWYAKYAAYSKTNKLFIVENNKLFPNQNVTRGEVADTIYKIIQLTQ